MNTKTIRVLAFDPVSYGLGFSVVEWPLTLVDWGVKSTRMSKKKPTLELVAYLIGQYRPTVIVLENCNAAESRRCDRIKKLIGGIIHTAHSHKIAVRVISRSQIREAFLPFGSISKYGIAYSIADQLPEMLPSLPRFRKPWMKEDYRMAIFTASSLALTYLYTKKRHD